MRIMRFCVVMASVVIAACFLSFYANQYSPKKAEIPLEKTPASEVLDEDLQEKEIEKFSIE